MSDHLHPGPVLQVQIKDMARAAPLAAFLGVPVEGAGWYTERGKAALLAAGSGLRCLAEFRLDMVPCAETWPG